MLEIIDPFYLKRYFDIANLLRAGLGDLGQDLSFLRALRRAFLPLPGLERRRPPDTAIFPPLVVRPHPTLAGARVGLVTSGGSGATVTLCGVKRALEEAGIRVSAISVCSGSALWGSMIAAGLSAQQMVDASLGWGPCDLLDLDLSVFRRLLFEAGRGFSGLLRGGALEQTLEGLYPGMTLGTAPIPYYAIVFNMDTNEVYYFGPHNRPEVPLARMARVALALPLLVQPVRFGEHLYVDGGIVDIFPLEPLLRHERPFDALLGVNTIMPAGFRGEDITGWLQRPWSLVRASQQLLRAQWLELARRQIAQVGERLLLLEPVPYSEIKGARFYQLFIDSTRWVELILAGYHHTRERLAAFQPSRRRSSRRQRG